MVLIVGLGNPGSEYDGTRHNAGFAVVDALAANLRLGLRHLGSHRTAAATRDGVDIVLSQPQTFMNNSGEVVARLLAELGAAPGDLIVCCDDLHLPLGSIRLRKQGGDGGHNGLRSIIRETGTDAFPRLRCGIRGATAPRPGEGSAEYVLSRFDPDEEAAAGAMTSGAVDALRAILRNGIDRAMNVVNAV